MWHLVALSPSCHTGYTWHLVAPSVHTPHVHTPRVRTPHVYTPHVHTPHVHTPRVHTPHVHTPRVHTPHVHTPHVHTPHVHTPDQAVGTSRLQLGGAPQCSQVRVLPCAARNFFPMTRLRGHCALASMRAQLSKRVNPLELPIRVSSVLPLCIKGITHMRDT